MIREGTAVKLVVTDGRKSINSYTGTIKYITKYLIGIDTGKFLESINIADLIATSNSMVRVKFKNEQGKYVRGYIKNHYKPSMEDILLEESFNQKGT